MRSSSPAGCTWGPLSDEALTALVTALTGGKPGPNLRPQIAGATGNPLIVRELIEALSQEGLLVAADGVAELIGKPVPISFQELVAGRLRSLPQPTTDALRLASVFGSDFARADLPSLLDRPASKVAATLEPALQNGLLGATDRRLAFRHGLVRDAVYERNSPQHPLRDPPADRTSAGVPRSRRGAGRDAFRPGS